MIITDTTSDTRTLTAKQKQDLAEHIKSHIEERDLVRRRLDEVKSSRAEAYAYVFALQLSFRGIDSEKLCLELAELAGIDKADYAKAAAQL